MLGAADPVAVPHSHAGAVRCVSVHGRVGPQGATVLRSAADHADACQVPAGLHVLATGKNAPSRAI